MGKSHKRYFNYNFQNQQILEKKNILPFDILKMCTVFYGIAVWSFNIQTFKTSEKANRTITCSRYDAQTDPIFKL